MVFRKGDVVLIPFPYTDLSTAEARPTVVVSSEPYHRANQEILGGLSPCNLVRRIPGWTTNCGIGGQRVC